MEFFPQWHGLSREEQAKYYDLARKERQLHMQMYPGWSARDNYAQNKKKKRKRMQQQQHQQQQQQQQLHQEKGGHSDSNGIRGLLCGFRVSKVFHISNF